MIVDVRMPPTCSDEGARAASQLRTEMPGLAVLILSQDIEPALLEVSRGAGGFGYLLKDRVLDITAFLGAVRRVALGGRAIDPDVVAALIQAREQASALAQLTDRERQILALMAEGLTNAGIARRLVLGERTIESHVTNSMRKLGITSTPTITAACKPSSRTCAPHADAPPRSQRPSFLAGTDHTSAAGRESQRNEWRHRRRRRLRSTGGQS